MSWVQVPKAMFFSYALPYNCADFFLFIVIWIFNNARTDSCLKQLECWMDGYFTFILHESTTIPECFCVLWHLVSGKGEKVSEHTATVALPSPFAIYNDRFELGLGQSMV